MSDAVAICSVLNICMYVRPCIAKRTHVNRMVLVLQLELHYRKRATLAVIKLVNICLSHKDNDKDEVRMCEDTDEMSSSHTSRQRSEICA